MRIKIKNNRDIDKFELFSQPFESENSQLCKAIDFNLIFFE